MVTLIRTRISGAAVTGGGVATMAFEDADDDSGRENNFDAVDAFWANLCTNFLDDDVTFQVEGTQTRYAASDGSLQQVYGGSDGTAHTGVVTGAAAPRASQALLRWKTDEVVNGRLLQGRTYIPGIPASALTDTGLLSDTYINGIVAAAETLLSDTNNGLVIWHRPVSGSGGSTELVTSASVWSQLAVLRSRRD